MSIFYAKKNLTNLFFIEDYHLGAHISIKFFDNFLAKFFDNFNLSSSNVELYNYLNKINFLKFNV